MKRSICVSCFILATCAAPSGLQGVELPVQMKVGNNQLVLNGSGSRQKYFLDLYVAALYLTQPTDQAAMIVNADAPMAIRIVMTSNMVTKEKLLESLQEGFQKSTGGQTAGIQAQIQQLHQCLSGEIARGVVFDLVYEPGRGVSVRRQGQLKGVIPGLAFKQALFGIWLSDEAVDAQLRFALLGQKSPRR